MGSIKEQVRGIIKKLYVRTHNIPIEHFTYQKDGLYTTHNSEFMKDEAFAQAYKLGKKTGSWGNADLEWRVYIACWAAKNVQNLEGDFVECGVNKGGISRAVMDYTNFNKLNKTFYLLDTFEGLSEDYITAEERKRGVHENRWEYKDCITEVKQTFKEFNVKIIKGTVPDTLAEVDTNKVSFLSIDMNSAYPEVEALKFFWDKMVKGGAILLDDYAWMYHIEQKRAIDKFAKERAINVLSLPTGQGLIIKN